MRNYLVSVQNTLNPDTERSRSARIPIKSPVSTPLNVREQNVHGNHPILNKYYLIIFAQLIFLMCENSSPNKKAPMEIVGAWKMVALSINTIKNEQKIVIDSAYDDKNFREIIIFHEDSVEFFVKDYLSSMITSNDSGGYYTVHTEEFYSISDDTITINTGGYDININAIIKIEKDTLVLNLTLDHQNPYSFQYGLGTMVRKYLPYDEKVPPVDWPEIF